MSGRAPIRSLSRPAIGATILLMLWSRTDEAARRADPVAEARLAALAPSIDWVEAADNYVELHVAGRTVQYHPEAGPGPHDARHLFDEFLELAA